MVPGRDHIYRSRSSFMQSQSSEVEVQTEVVSNNLELSGETSSIEYSFPANYPIEGKIGPIRLENTLKNNRKRTKIIGIHANKVLLLENDTVSLYSIVKDSTFIPVQDSEELNAWCNIWPAANRERAGNLPDNISAFYGFLEQGYSLSWKMDGSRRLFRLTSADQSATSNWFEHDKSDRINANAFGPFNQDGLFQGSLTSVLSRDEINVVYVSQETFNQQPGLILFNSTPAGVYKIAREEGGDVFVVYANTPKDKMKVLANTNLNNEFGNWYNQNNQALALLFPSLSNPTPVDYLLAAYENQDQASKHLTSLSMLGETFLNGTRSVLTQDGDVTINLSETNLTQLGVSNNVYAELTMGSNLSFERRPVRFPRLSFRGASNAAQKKLTAYILGLDLFDASKYSSSIDVNALREKYSTFIQELFPNNRLKARFELFFRSPSYMFARLNPAQRKTYLDMMTVFLQHDSLLNQKTIVGAYEVNVINNLPCFGLLQTEDAPIQIDLNQQDNQDYRVNPHQREILNSSQLFTVSNTHITHFNGNSIEPSIGIRKGARVKLMQDGQKCTLVFSYLRNGQIVDEQIQEFDYQERNATLKGRQYLRALRSLVKSINRDEAMSFNYQDLLVNQAGALKLNSNVMQNVRMLRSGYSQVESLPVLSSSSKIFVESSTQQEQGYVNIARIVDGEKVYVIKFDSVYPIELHAAPQTSFDSFIIDSMGVSIGSKISTREARAFQAPDLYKVGNFSVCFAGMSHAVKEGLNNGERLNRTFLRHFIVAKNLKFTASTNFIEFKSDSSGKITEFRAVPYGDFLPLQREFIDQTNTLFESEEYSKFDRWQQQDVELQKQIRLEQSQDMIISGGLDQQKINEMVSTINGILEREGLTEDLVYNAETKLFTYNGINYANIVFFRSNGNKSLYLNHTIIKQNAQTEVDMINIEQLKGNQQRSFKDRLKFELDQPVPSKYSSLVEYEAYLKLFEKAGVLPGSSVECNQNGLQYFNSIESEELKELLTCPDPFILNNDKTKLFKNDTWVDIPEVSSLKVFNMSGLTGLRMLPAALQELTQLRMLESRQTSIAAFSVNDFMSLAQGKTIQAALLYTYVTRSDYELCVADFDSTTDIQSLIPLFQAFPPEYRSTWLRPLPVIVDTAVSNAENENQVSGSDYLILGANQQASTKRRITRHCSGPYKNPRRPLNNVELRLLKETIMPDGYKFGMYAGVLHTVDSMAETPRVLAHLAEQLSPYGLVHGGYFFPRIRDRSENTSRPEYKAPPIKLSLSDTYELTTNEEFKVNGIQICALYNEVATGISINPADNSLPESARNRFSVISALTFSEELKVYAGLISIKPGLNMTVRKIGENIPDLNLRENISELKITSEPNEFIVKQSDNTYRIKFNT